MIKFFHEKSIWTKNVAFRHEKRSYGEFCIERKRSEQNAVKPISPTQTRPVTVKFWNEKLISTSYVAFRHENRSFGEFCFDIVESDVFKPILASYVEFCHENSILIKIVAFRR